MIKNAWHYIPNGTPDIPAQQIEDMMANHCPLGRCALPDDVARVVGFLASQDGGWVNGKPSLYSQCAGLSLIISPLQAKSSPSPVVLPNRRQREVSVEWSTAAEFWVLIYQGSSLQFNAKEKERALQTDIGSQDCLNVHIHNRKMSTSLNSWIIPILLNGLR